MHIGKDTVPTLSYKVFEADGKLLEAPREPLVYLHGGYGTTLAAIENALEGKAVGFQATLALPKEQAFGAHNDALVQTIDKRDFPPGVKVGGQLEGRDEGGAPQMFRVVKIKGDKVLLDGNHPFAGKALRFVLKVTDVRAATPEEIEHRHVHGDHGHEH
ncbi:MAG: peptidylprolyl isomerase [Variovorax sp.]